MAYDSKEKASAAGKAYYVANKTKILARQKQRRDEGSTYAKDYYEANKARITERDAAYRVTNREKRNAACKAWHVANKERAAARSKAYYEAHKHTDKWREANKRGYAKNKEAYRARDTRHKTNLRGQYAALTADEKWMMKEAYKLARLREQVCGGRWEIDHIKALSSGGAHHPTNIQVVPRFFNRSKGAVHQTRFFGAQE